MKIYITGEINSDTFETVASAVDQALYDNERLDIIINSHGGNAIDGLAIYSKIRRFRKSYNLQVNVAAYGECSSAAVIILAAGKKRRMAKEAWVMVHEDQADLEGSSTSQFEIEAKQQRRLEDQWCKILAKETLTSKEEWSRLHKQTTYLSADECLKLGLITEVI